MRYAALLLLAACLAGPLAIPAQSATLRPLGTAAEPSPAIVDVVACGPHARYVRGHKVHGHFVKGHCVRVHR